MRVAAILICVGLVTGFGAARASNAEYFELRQQTPDVGSKMKRPLVRGTLPLDKTYAELSDSQKARLRVHYEDMPAADEPPFPARSLHEAYKTLARAQEDARVEGPLLVYVDVDSRGKAKSVSVAKAPSTELGELAARVLMQEQYKPGLCKGQPCSMEFPFELEFMPMPTQNRIVRSDIGRD